MGKGIYLAARVVDMNVAVDLEGTLSMILGLVLLLTVLLREFMRVLA